MPALQVRLGQLARSHLAPTTSGMVAERCRFLAFYVIMTLSAQMVSRRPACHTYLVHGLGSLDPWVRETSDELHVCAIEGRFATEYHAKLWTSGVGTMPNARLMHGHAPEAERILRTVLELLDVDW